MLTFEYEKKINEKRKKTEKGGGGGGGGGGGDGPMWQNKRNFLQWFIFLLSFTQQTQRSLPYLHNAKTW
jgi:hypothetical protein